MGKCWFGSKFIASAGYDALRELLEIEFAQDGQVWQYYDVPEEIWYRFKRELRPDYFFHVNIKGCYKERRVSSNRR